MQTTNALRALSGSFNQSASNFALSVVSRQISFMLQSKGYTEPKVQSDTNGEPKSDERPAFDLAHAVKDDFGSEFSFMNQERAAFDVDSATRAYACCMVLCKDALDMPLEYGRKPEAGSLQKYFTTPAAWFTSKVEYWTSTIAKQEHAKGTLYSVDSAKIAQRIDAQVQEKVEALKTRTAFLQRSISAAIKETMALDREEVIAELGQRLLALGFNFDEEVCNAGKNTLKIRRERYEAGEKVSTPQPGLLALWKACGVTGI